MAVTLVFSVPLVWLLMRTDIPFKNTFYILMTVGILIPVFLRTFAWILLLSPRIGILNRWAMGLFGLTEAPLSLYNIPGMAFIQGVSFVPGAFFMLAAAYRAMDPSLEEAAYTSGVGKLRTFLRINIPITMPAIAAMVFQSYAIWPHMSVFKNVAFPLTEGQRRFPRSVIGDKVRQALARVQLSGLEDRPATDLSGGQQQRVAMARAIVTEPQILLMDEPLSNLDARLRDQMRTELKKITSSIGVTTLYVTHDQAEALSLGDKVCVMNKGEILQVGPPHEVYESPPDLFVAQFVGEMNFVDATVKDVSVVHAAFGDVNVPRPIEHPVGSAVVLAIRPEHVVLEDASKTHNGESIEGRITSRTYVGNAAAYEIETCGITVLAMLPGDATFTVGQTARVLFPQDRWHVYSPAGRQ